MNLPTPQHAANAAVIAAPAVSWQLSLPETVTVVVGLLGAIYYLMLMFDWVNKKIAVYRQIKRSSRTIAERLLEEHDAARAADKDTTSAD